jgi:hypothetical protein
MGHLDTVRALVHAVCERERERAREPWCMRYARERERERASPGACGMHSFALVHAVCSRSRLLHAARRAGRVKRP